MIDNAYPHNIVFLDIDGVLLSYRPEKIFDEICYGASEQIIDVFLRIIEEAAIPTKIVLISSKVISPDPYRWIPTEKLRLRFKKLLHPDNPSVDIPFIQENRYKGIRKWLNLYGHSVNKAIAIDDSIKWYIDETNQDLSSDFYLIPCHTYLGMNWPELRALKVLLKYESSSMDKQFLCTFLSHSYLDSRSEDLYKFWETKIIPKFRVDDES